ncbi:MAG: HDIG domain-containing protein [Candidatus Fermentithermobacillus carboniphilus]|uniref:HDIG domain-containing protein n=1 Tax=Candidatus Fermentithermobacillus carboniphilus TaxID=3085328 RepID=A0AAT9LEK3_9FIRM|nr:MAG: HDIG domain-containing protein [Candidatus Fermentithermobacillus carboniphilus]
MTREELLDEVQKRIRTKNLFKHILAVEAVMRRLARHFGEDEDRWGAAGLLHDIDYEETKDDPNTHSLISGKIAEELGFDREIVDAVKAHNEAHGLPRDTRMAKALYSADPLTGLIVASALISPSKKLSGIDADFVIHRMGEKSFARGANRDAIKACSELGLDLREFIAMGLEAMQGISEELGL